MNELKVTPYGTNILYTPLDDVLDVTKLIGAGTSGYTISTVWNAFRLLCESEQQCLYAKLRQIV